MDRDHTLDMVANIRRAAERCDSSIAEMRQTIVASRAAGENTEERIAALTELEIEYNRLMREMEKLLDQLDMTDRFSEQSAVKDSGQQPTQS
jgi:chromosome segregation ATPase